MASIGKTEDKINTNEIEENKDGNTKEQKDVKPRNISPRKEKAKANERKPKTDSKSTESKAEKSGIKVKKGAADETKDVRENVNDTESQSFSKEESMENKKEKMEFPCEACASEGVSVESTNYCSECAENICAECVQQHRKFPTMKTHTILGKASRRRCSTMKSDNEEKSSQLRLLECDGHPGKQVEMFCKHHDSVWCVVCMAVNHRSCESVSFIKECCKSITRTKECKDLRVNVRKLKKEVDAMQVKVEKNMESLVKRKDEALGAIKAYRKRIDDKLNQIEEETIRQLNQVYEKNSAEIEDDVTECKKAAVDLEEIEEVMDLKPTDTNADFNMFVYMKRANPRIVYANELMQNVSKKLGDERIKFCLDTRFVEWLDEGYQSFGHFLYKYTTETASVAIEKDKKKCIVNEIADLVDGRFLLSDSSNKRLKLFEKDFKYIDHMDLPNSPYGVSSLDRSSAVVSLPEEKVVQFVNLDPRISLINSIDVGEPCRGLSSFEGEVYVVCGGLEGECQGHVRIYSMSGEIMRSIERDNFGNVLFTTPVGICVSKMTGNIHITDRKRGIISMKQSGELLPHISDKALLSPSGICEDDKRQLFVTGHESNDIWQIRDGTQLGIILKNKDGVKAPLCILYATSSSKIIFAMKDCNHLTVCTPLTYLPQEELSEVKGQSRHKLRHKVT